MTATVQQSPSRAYFLALTAMMWLALPFAGFRYWQVWSQLPSRMVTHFDAAGRPNGWMSPQGSLNFTLGLLLFLLTLFSAILLCAFRRAPKPDTSMWALLGLFCVVIAVFAFISDAVLGYNLSQSSLQIGPAIAGLFMAIFVFTLIYLRVHRGAALPVADVFAEETHSSRIFALIFLVPAAAQVSAAIAVPIAGVRVALGLGAALMLIGAAFAWDGFHYRFSPAGLDIRTLGCRLRTIHTADIREYAAAPWSVLGGYGIRGLGGHRAYVWGNTGVRIKTTVGEVFLGHREPQTLIRDLDLVTRGHEVGVSKF